MKWFFFGFRLCPMECYQYFGLLPVGKPLYFVLMLFWLVLVIFWLNNPRDFFSKSQGIYARTRNFIPLTDFFSKNQGIFPKVRDLFPMSDFFFKDCFFFKKAGKFCQRWVILSGVIMVARVVVLLPDNGSEWELEW